MAKSTTDVLDVSGGAKDGVLFVLVRLWSGIREMRKGEGGGKGVRHRDRQTERHTDRQVGRRTYSLTYI